MENKYVGRVILEPEVEQTVASAEIKVGDIMIRDISVWRSSNGRLRVFFPGHEKIGMAWADSIALPAELRSEIEAEIIAAYRKQKREMERKADPK